MSLLHQQQNGAYRVMIVDDEPDVRSMVRQILLASGFLVILAGSGEVAISIYNEEFSSRREISLVILDMTLPGGMTGVETFEMLCQIDPEVKVIASSGYFDESAAQSARRIGFAGILPKPYTAEALVKLVQDRVTLPA